MAATPPRPPVSAQDTMHFDITLHCTQTEVTKQEKLVYSPIPAGACVRHLKLQIEKSFQIPACVQTLSYEAHPLHNNATLANLRVRSGDTIQVDYTSEGDCEELIQVISWLGQLLGGLKLENPSMTSGLSPGLNQLIMVGIEAEFIEELAFNYFYPWLDARKYANKLHFVDNGGIDIIMEVYTLLQRQPWKNTPMKLKYLEYGILRVLWNFSETFALRRLITSHGGLQLCMRSLLRKKLEKGKEIVDGESQGQEPHQDWILVETIGAALGTFCNLSELPETHLVIATEPDVLLQLTCISLTPSVSIMSPQLVATLFLCMAYTSATHVHLASPAILERLLEACTKDRIFGRDDNEHVDTLMLKYFTQIFLSQLVLVSPSYISPDLYQPLLDFMENLVPTLDHRTIMEGEIKRWYVWSTFVPYVKLAYVPDSPQSEEIQRLKLLSLKAIVLGLHNMLGRANHREVLVREGLLDYVVCMPLYVPEAIRPQTVELVAMLATCGDLQVQPPSLTTAVKARLAKTYLGLEKVLRLSVGEIISESWPT